MLLKTQHGMINVETKEYICERKPEHFFVKFQGFGISMTEIVQCQERGVETIVIHYFGKRRLKYTFDFSLCTEMPLYNNGHDLQLILKKKVMKEEEIKFGGESNGN